MRGSHSRGAGVVAEVLDRRRLALWGSDLYGAQRGHTEAWQICLPRQRSDRSYAFNADGAAFARYIRVLLRAVVLARRHDTLG